MQKIQKFHRVWIKLALCALSLLKKLIELCFIFSEQLRLNITLFWFQHSVKAKQMSKLLNQYKPLVLSFIALLGAQHWVVLRAARSLKVGPLGIWSWDLCSGFAYHVRSCSDVSPINQLLKYEVFEFFASSWGRKPNSKIGESIKMPVDFHGFSPSHLLNCY